MVQARLNSTVFPFVLQGRPLTLDAETVAQDALRTPGANLAPFTVMSQISATRLWMPFIYAGGAEPVDGSYLPMGIYIGQDPITAAAIIAGNVTNVPILVGGGALVDGGQLVFDVGGRGVAVALTLNTVLVPGTVAAWVNYWSMTARRFLEQRGIYVQATVGLDDLTT